MIIFKKKVKFFLILLFAIALCCFACFTYMFNKGCDFLGQHETGVHVITNYPLMYEKPWNENQTETNKTRLRQRQEEVEETLQRNLDHPFVKAVHLLVDQQLAELRLSKLLLRNKQKIFVHRIKAMPRYRHFLEYVSDRLLNKTVIIMNMDIYIGEGLEKLNKTFLVKSGVSYVLTRSGRQEKRCSMAGKRGYCDTNYISSHDAFMFVLTKHVDESVLFELDYDMHVFGGENRLLWVLKNLMTMKLLNPCRYIRIYHNHCIDIHSRYRARINRARKKNAVAGFSGLYGKHPRSFNKEFSPLCC